MEKKTKKLQLRKETIAVLNGEKLSQVVGGGTGPTEGPCGPNEHYEACCPPGCYCNDGYVRGNDGKCIRLEDVK